MATPRRARLEMVGEAQSATTIELFFDLVFVFALTLVTDLAGRGDRPHPKCVRAVLVHRPDVVVWIGYSWLGNVVKADEGIIRVAMFAAMGGGCSCRHHHSRRHSTICPAAGTARWSSRSPTSPCAARAPDAVLVRQRGDPQLRGQLLRCLPSMLTRHRAAAGRLADHRTTQIPLWFAALVGDYFGTCSPARTGG